MNKLVQSCAIALTLTITAQGAAAEEKLVLYNWFEYMPQELLNKFTAETGIEVTMESYDSNESMLATLKAGGLGTYDIAVPSDYMVTIMIEEGLLDPIRHDEFANFDNIETEWADVAFDPGRGYSLPYQWGSTSFSVNRDVYSGDINTTDILFNPPAELAGKINMLDSQGDVLLFASLHLGIPQCSTDREQLKALNALVLAAKPNWVSFNSDTAKEVMVSGDALVGMNYNGFAAKAREEGAPIEYAYPTQGYVWWADSLVILKDAPNRANAIKFMDFMLEPENVAALTNFVRYSASVKGVADLLDPTLANLPEGNPPAGAPQGTFIQVCDEATQKVYDRIWTNLKK